MAMPPLLPGVIKNPRLRLLLQTPLQIELTVSLPRDHPNAAFRVVPRQQGGQTVGARVEEIWDCEPDSEERVRRTTRALYPYELHPYQE